jgi:hypothetical protein
MLTPLKTARRPEANHESIAETQVTLALYVDVRRHFSAIPF